MITTLFYNIHILASCLSFIRVFLIFLSHVDSLIAAFCITIRLIVVQELMRK